MVARSHDLLVFLYLTHELSLNASPFVKLVALGTADRAMWSRERLGWLLRSSLAACELGDRSGCVMCSSSEILGLCLLVFFLSVCVARFSLIAGMCGCSKPARSRAADSCLQP